MSTMEMLINEVSEAPNAMLDEVLDFVRFLKSSRFAPEQDVEPASANDGFEVVYERPRTVSDLANEQRAFLASLPPNFADVELPSEE